MEATLIISILIVAIQAGTSLVYATVGEIFAERSGILNLGVEGMMIMGAVTAFAGAYHTGSAWVGIIIALVVGGLLAVIHAFLTISLPRRPGSLRLGVDDLRHRPGQLFRTTDGARGKAAGRSGRPSLRTYRHSAAVPHPCDRRSAVQSKHPGVWDVCAGAGGLVLDLPHTTGSASAFGG